MMAGGTALTAAPLMPRRRVVADLLAALARSVLELLSMSGTLSHRDVERLLADPSPSARADTAAKLGAQIDRPDLTEAERVLAQEIVRIMAGDASTLVRQALSAAVRSATSLPHDVALKLAQDIASVSLPILEASDVLSDADLVALVRQLSPEQQQAIARRPKVSEPVSDALVGTDNADVVGTLVGNPGARIAEPSLARVVETFGDREDILEPLIRRQILPVTVTEKLVAKLSDRLREQLVERHELPADTAVELILRARERATVDLLEPRGKAADADLLAAQLHAHGRLTPTLVLRALCVGDMALFESCLAARAGIPTLNARTLIHDAGKRGFSSLYAKAEMPQELLHTFRIALDIAVQTDMREADYDRNSYSRVMIERILTQAEDLQEDEADFLLRKLNDLAPPGYSAAH